ncbi:hypothetical protein [Methanonatronarchaeum sp. AMET6-2]|uniref:hypothetical protein n=1 Tax=Methanonatronarchaeum sp. AMET6-2 TaxID=2933293 RepID=UPI001FF4BF84|nr:hypothetical protein [Methanonatronarchaeum sp. AMET6-2]UOY10280.1 hypothetical protein MU439_01215 [Methanonatronarchaeum sp. AMET6-2]
MVKNPEYHFDLGIYKIIRPEVTLSFKGAKKRDKDRKDLRLIENSGIFESEEWKWRRVNIVPAWERQSSNSNQNLINRGIKALKREGLFYVSNYVAKIALSKISHKLSLLNPERVDWSKKYLSETD